MATLDVATVSEKSLQQNAIIRPTSFILNLALGKGLFVLFEQFNQYTCVFISLG